MAKSSMRLINLLRTLLSVWLRVVIRLFELLVYLIDICICQMKRDHFADEKGTTLQWY